MMKQQQDIITKTINSIVLQCALCIVIEWLVVVYITANYVLQTALQAKLRLRTKPETELELDDRRHEHEHNETDVVAK